MGVWKDVKEPIDYIYAKYNRPIYLFACSLGGICSTIYLINDQKSPVKAAAFYGSPIAIAKNQDYFTNSGFGLYNHVFGHSLLSKQKNNLDQVMKMSTPEQIKMYNTLLEGRAPSHLNNIDEFMVAPMFGYKDREDYR